jgi:membrane-bound serine protease (ClpP class)
MNRAIKSAAAVVLLSVATSAHAQTLAERTDIVRVPVTGTIELGLAPFVERSLREAEAAGARAVVLDIDTPGGRVDAAERIADAVRESIVPVYAYINRRAFSAGALIALATERVFMLPGSVMGAATPVTGSGDKAPEKIVSAMRSEMRALAEERGLDPRVAEAMVDESIAIEGVVEAGKLLTLTTEEAVGLGFAASVADWGTMLDTIGLETGATVRVARVNWAERLVRFLSHPVVAPFLLSLGFLGLIAEIKTPSFGLAGAAGFLALSLFFGSHLILGLAGWEDLLIFGVGIALLAVEAFVIPGFGIFGVLGVAGVVGGLFMSLLGALPTLPDMAQAGGVLALALLLVLISGWAILRRLPNSGRLARRGILLDTETDRATGYVSQAVRADLVGREGVAITDLRPSGVGLFGDERIDIVSESEWIPGGTPIRIVSSEGYRHVVRAVGRLPEPETTVADQA